MLQQNVSWHLTLYIIMPKNLNLNKKNMYIQYDIESIYVSVDAAGQTCRNRKNWVKLHIISHFIIGNITKVIIFGIIYNTIKDLVLPGIIGIIYAMY